MNKTINIFIDNMFTGIEETNQIKELKQDLKISSNDKYLDLLSQGVGENEAIGRIISEFGTLEELLNEVDFTPQEANYNTDFRVVERRRNGRLKHNTIYDKIIGSIFILATIVYLLTGFLFNLWGIMWIIYPVCALIAAIINIFRNE